MSVRVTNNFSGSVQIRVNTDGNSNEDFIVLEAEGSQSWERQEGYYQLQVTFSEDLEVV